VLEQQDSNLAVKMIPLRFQDMERRGYDLVLTTHDGTGGLVMNETLDNARISEYDHREQRRRGQQSVMPFVDELEDIARPTPEPADILVVTQQIMEQCRGEVVAYREVLRRMVNSPYYADDVKSATNDLRKRRLIKFDPPLRNNSVIDFR